MNFKPKECEKQFISKDIDIIYMNDMYKIIAKNNIKRGTVVLIEIPQFNLFGEKNENNVLQMLYILLQNKDNIHIKNLYPRNNIEILNTDNNPYIVNIIRLINNHTNHKIKKYLLSYDKNTLYTYYYKYLFNAFSMYSTATILPIGAMMNHSCMPNIKFYEKNNAMYFETICDIKKNTELCYSYLRNYKYVSKQDKINYLINHYNFICNDCNHLF